MTDLFILFQLAAGIYLLIGAIRGKGKLFQNEYLKISREKYIKVMRILCAVSGVALIFTNTLEILGLFTMDSLPGWIGWILGFGTLIALMIFTMRATDRKSAAIGRKTTGVDDPLRAAFIFDDEDNVKKK